MAKYRIKRFSEEQTPDEKLQERNKKLKSTALKAGLATAAIGAGVYGYKTADKSSGMQKAVSKAVDAAKTTVRNSDAYTRNTTKLENFARLSNVASDRFKESAKTAADQNKSWMNTMTTKAADKAAQNFRQTRALKYAGAGLAAAGVTAGAAYLLKRRREQKKVKDALNQED